jgi:hypothetical protein
MSRKSPRAAIGSGVSDVADALSGVGDTVVESVTKTGRRARKQAKSLASKAASALPDSISPKPKPKHRKRKFAVIVLVLAGAGVAAKKVLGGKSDSTKTE